MAGVPPDAFTDDGQLWGNPLYDWPALQRRGYAWWIARFRRIFELFDLVRIDHFRAFTAYWAVPADAESALAGEWKRGPGRAPFDAARARARRVAADRRGPRRDHAAGQAAARVARAAGHGRAAVRLHAVERAHPHVPENHEREPGRLHRHPRQRHDPRLVRRARARAARLLGEALWQPRHRGPEPHWALIRLAFASPARIAMIQLQDALGLGPEGRMNQPGTRRRRGAGGWTRYRPRTSAAARRPRGEPPSMPDRLTVRP